MQGNGTCKPCPPFVQDGAPHLIPSHDMTEAAAILRLLYGPTPEGERLPAIACTCSDVAKVLYRNIILDDKSWKWGTLSWAISRERHSECSSTLQWYRHCGNTKKQTSQGEVLIARCCASVFRQRGDVLEAAVLTFK